MTNNSAIDDDVTSVADAHEDTLSRLDAMRSEEDETHCTYDYLQCANREKINEDDRRSMVQWCHQVQKALKLSRETAWIAMSYFDRYLSSGKGDSGYALQDRYQFQLAAITSFYIAVKVNETSQLNVKTLVRICKKYYPVEDILDMEQDILFALDWRMSTPTPMQFVEQYIQLLPAKIKSRTKDILEICKSHIYSIATDMYFVFCKPSVVGASCLAAALTQLNLLSKQERSDFWLHLARITDLIDTMEAQAKLLTGKPVCKPISWSKTPAKSSLVERVTKHSVQKNVQKDTKHPVQKNVQISPVCVTFVAPQV